MIGWQTRSGMPVPQRVEFDPAFTRALYALSKERGGGYIPLPDVEARAFKCQVVILPLPAVVKIPPLPITSVIIPRLP